MPSKTETPFFRTCVQCGVITYYGTKHLLNRATKRSDRCASCVRRLMWTPELKAWKSQLVRAQRAEPGNPWSTDEAKRKKGESLVAAHRRPDCYKDGWQKKIASAHRKLATEGRHPFQHLTDEAREKARRNAALTRSLPGSKWNARQRFRRTDEGRQEASRIMRRSRAENPVFRTLTYRRRNQEALTRARRLLKRSCVSRHERALASQLQEIDARFVLCDRAFTVGPYHPDIVHHESKMIVEFYGDYPHSNPKKYDANFWNALRRKFAHDVWGSDAKRKTFLEEQGWTVIVVWEDEWKASRERIASYILNITKDVK